MSLHANLGGSETDLRRCTPGGGFGAAVSSARLDKLFGSADVPQAMKKEIDALRKLRHPRLVRFIGACVQPPLLLVVTEPWTASSVLQTLKSIKA